MRSRPIRLTLATFALLLVFQGVALAQPYQVEGEKQAAYYTVNTSASGILNVRAQPSKNAELIASLAAGTLVFTTGNKATAEGVKWFEITQGEFKGWTNSKFLYAVDYNWSRKDLFDSGIGVGDLQHPNKCPEDIEPKLSISNAMLEHFQKRGFTLGSLCFAIVDPPNFDPETGVEVPKVLVNIDDNTQYKVALNVPDCLKDATPFATCKFNFEWQYGAAIDAEDRPIYARFGSALDNAVSKKLQDRSAGKDASKEFSWSIVGREEIKNLSRLRSRRIYSLLPKLVVSKNLPKGFGIKLVHAYMRGPGPEGDRDRGTGIKAAPWSAPSSEIGNASCASLGYCTAVPIFFGTTRSRSDLSNRISFGSDRAKAFTLGRAIVTVPKSNRSRGSVDRPSWWDLLSLRNPLKEDPALHFTIPNAGITLFSAEADFIKSVRLHVDDPANADKHAFIYIHGFNNSFDDALYRGAQLAYDLNSKATPFGTAFLFSWASAGDVEDYVYDLDSARAELATESLRRFLEIVATKSGAKHVHIIAHSMGNLPTLLALQAISKVQAKRRLFEQVIFAAPDIDVEEFERIAKLVSNTAMGFTLYASSSDRAIGASKKIRRNYPRAGDVPPEGPVVLPGIDTVDVSAISSEIFSLRHSVYADKVELLRDMYELMRNGTRPPNSRDSRFNPLAKGALNYWVYREAGR